MSKRSSFVVNVRIVHSDVMRMDVKPLVSFEILNHVLCHRGNAGWFHSATQFLNVLMVRLFCVASCIGYLSIMEEQGYPQQYYGLENHSPARLYLF